MAPHRQFQSPDGNFAHRQSEPLDGNVLLLERRVYIAWLSSHRRVCLACKPQKCRRIKFLPLRRQVILKRGNLKAIYRTPFKYYMLQATYKYKYINTNINKNKTNKMGLDKLPSSREIVVRVRIFALNDTQTTVYAYIYTHCARNTHTRLIFCQGCLSLVVDFSAPP